MSDQLPGDAEASLETTVEGALSKMLPSSPSDA